jgi:nucleotide-binding universal stress UspA family protein
MFRHILVALDLSELGRRVMQRAIALAQVTGARLTLLHVLSTEETMSPAMPLIPVPDFYSTLSATTMELYQEEWKSFEARGKQVLEGYRREAEMAQVVVETVQQSGSPGRVICRLAQELDTDLILIGRRGHSGLSELLIGSVSNYVVHHGKCSVMVVNATTEDRVRKPQSSEHEATLPS